MKECTMHWIPTSKRLPELYEKVLVTDGECVEMSMLGRRYDEGYVWLFDTCWNDLEDLPYWMPLPEPPTLSKTMTIEEMADRYAKEDTLSVHQIMKGETE